eukprot:TRINITY_DN14378_c0_g8_i1.p1 TRINITY_DN14378_c0_g8~~TRINITY_DN14378_c0_g8_i1.p1  ORF type:complete len:394 (+),score=52.90 TRINITY_DN14378_c0_g8_i1:62-1243(+)
MLQSMLRDVEEKLKDLSKSLSVSQTRQEEREVRFQAQIGELKSTVSEQKRLLQVATREVQRLKSGLAQNWGTIQAEQDSHTEEMQKLKQVHAKELYNADQTVRVLRKQVTSLRGKVKHLGNQTFFLGKQKVGKRQCNNRFTKACNHFVGFLDQLGASYGGTYTAASKGGYIDRGMQEVLKRAEAHKMGYNVASWLPKDTMKVLEKSILNKVQKSVRNPARFATAQQKAKISYLRAFTFAREILPKGRGWRPHIAQVVAARRETDLEMQKIMPIWATPDKGGNFVSLTRLLQLVLPWYIEEASVGHSWDALRQDGGQPWNVYRAEESGGNPLLDVHGRPYAEWAVSVEAMERGPVMCRAASAAKFVDSKSTGRAKTGSFWYVRYLETTLQSIWN